MKHHYSREQIEALVNAAGGTDKAREILAVLGEVSGAWYLQSCDETNFAHHLLTQRTPRPEIVKRMVSRFGIAERSAWRRVSAALKQPLS